MVCVLSFHPWGLWEAFLGFEDDDMMCLSLLLLSSASFRPRHKRPEPKCERTKPFALGD